MAASHVGVGCPTRAVEAGIGSEQGIIARQNFVGLREAVHGGDAPTPPIWG
eukprot:COSAG01_NODE_38025_length_495_cov_1.260101_1_plen_50_part_10